MASSLRRPADNLPVGGRGHRPGIPLRLRRSSPPSPVPVRGLGRELVVGPAGLGMRVVVADRYLAIAEATAGAQVTAVVPGRVPPAQVVRTGLGLLASDTAGQVVELLG